MQSKLLVKVTSSVVDGKNEHKISLNTGYNQYSVIYEKFCALQLYLSSSLQRSIGTVIVR